MSGEKLTEWQKSRMGVYDDIINPDKMIKRKLKNKWKHPMRMTKEEKKERGYENKN